jgi:hypothetical protein
MLDKLEKARSTDNVQRKLRLLYSVAKKAKKHNHSVVYFSGCAVFGCVGKEAIEYLAGLQTADDFEAGLDRYIDLMMKDIRLSGVES